MVNLYPKRSDVIFYFLCNEAGAKPVLVGFEESACGAMKRSPCGAVVSASARNAGDLGSSPTARSAVLAFRFHEG